ncbi:Myc-type, basic helix-loop-helix (bHLH) domain-containing protein [Cynara cardunculus var. scolymus]|uniref:Myc-type, basic helix-loop-helix (BHLH) domain-containing protein n=1 Tax=Cynara cardunculus var. scolymus TaxID=59895 RepID=A0A118K337_CYNCS|nr:Myc-type, basic helix-loop-helix (bHLH) domain-containing protein [Cynara cardunculus var. scolymus]
MKSSKGHQEDEEEDYEDFGAKKDNTASSNTSKDGKSSDKANATRSKHSVTEQRRRSKINERHAYWSAAVDIKERLLETVVTEFQILRDLIPNSDQKRDTASFLLEVIEYVQYLQEKVHKYEGSYQGWNAEPTKLMPWRNSHWRVPNFGQPPVLKSDSGQAPSFPVRFDENVSVAPAVNTTTPQNPSTDGDANQQEELTVEGGTISISSVYSQGLLNSLTQALQNSGVDLSQATISVQVDLGKRANRGIGKDEQEEFSNGDKSSSDQAQKRLKT